MVKLRQDYPKMRLALRYWLLGKGWNHAVRAMDFAEQYHTGTRKDGQPEFSHQVSQVSYAKAFAPYLMFPEETICVIFFHDIVEDYDVTYNQIVDLFTDREFGIRVADAVMKMSKVINGAKKQNDFYYNEMGKCPIASFAKGADRGHNLMTMVGGFTHEKQESYLAETYTYVNPMLKRARRRFPEQEPAYENIKYVMTNQCLLYEEIIKNAKKGNVAPA